MNCRTVIAAALFALLSVTAARAESLNAGKEAYMRHDYSRAVAEWQPLAERGNPRAQNNMGMLYQNGEGVKRNYAAAIDWYRRAADRGNVEAYNNLGIMYDHGMGVKKDYAEAAKWYKRAADKGMADAQFNLGVMYYSGLGVKRDPARALEQFRKAGKQGDVRAQYNAGMLFASGGGGIERSNIIAWRWLNRAAQAGDKNAARQRAALQKKMSKTELAEAKNR